MVKWSFERWKYRIAGRWIARTETGGQCFSDKSPISISPHLSRARAFLFQRHFYPMQRNLGNLSSSSRLGVSRHHTPPPNPAPSFITPVFFARFFPMFSPPFSFCHWLGSHDWDILGSLSLLQKLCKIMCEMCAWKRITFRLATKITEGLNNVEF